MIITFSLSAPVSTNVENTGLGLRAEALQLSMVAPRGRQNIGTVGGSGKLGMSSAGYRLRISVKRNNNVLRNITTTMSTITLYHIDGLVKERRISSALAVELHLSCTNPSTYGLIMSQGISSHGWDLPSNIYYKPHQIPKLKCFLSCLAIVFAQSIEARW